MKVLMVSDVYFPRVNGVSTSIETFRSKLPTQDVTVDLLVPDYGKDAAEDGVYRVASSPVPRDPEDRLMSWWKAKRLFPILSANDYQVIHIQTPFIAHYLGIRLARRLGLPVVATYHTLFEEYLQHYLPMLPASWLRACARAVSRWQCNGLDRVIVPSLAMAERLKSYGVTVPLRVLPTGIPLVRFQGGNRQRFREDYGIESSRPVALFVGRVAFEKNIQFLIESLESLRVTQPDILLVIAGEGPARQTLVEQVARRGLQNHVLFLGYLDRETGLPDVYAGSDVFVFASRTETQGLVLLEAMAAGLPVVALAIMGTKDILRPELGARIAPDDPQGFAQAVDDVLGSSATRRKMRLEGMAYAAEWSDDAMAQRLATLYTELKKN